MVADGVAHAERLARQVAFLETHPDHAAVSAWIDCVDDSGRRRRIKRKPVAADEWPAAACSARAASMWRAWRAFCTSPLRRWAWPGPRRQIFRRWTGSF